MWSVPGGRVEHGEALADAVVRELEEETGLVGECGALLGWGEHVEGEHHSVVLDFAVTLVGDAQPRAGDDAAAVEWVPLPEVMARPLVRGLAEVLAEHGIVELPA
jgi:8-oxo-dGTP diphosphatase